MCLDFLRVKFILLWENLQPQNSSLIQQFTFDRDRSHSAPTIYFSIFSAVRWCFFFFFRREAYLYFSYLSLNQKRKVTTLGDLVRDEYQLWKNPFKNPMPVAILSIKCVCVYTFRLYFWGSKITADGDCSHEIKTLTPWKQSYDQPKQHIKKQRGVDKDLPRLKTTGKQRGLLPIGR